MSLNESLTFQLSEKVLKNIIESLPGPYLILAPDAPRFTIIEANKSYLNDFLKKKEELIGKSFFEIFPHVTVDTTGMNIKSMTSSLLFVLHEKKEHKLNIQKYYILNPLSHAFEERYWSPINKPILNEQGEVTYIIHSPVDVTENVLLKKEEQIARKELEWQQQSLFNFFMQAPVAIGIVEGPRFIVKLANPYICSIWGRTEKEVLDKPILNVLTEVAEQGLKDLLTYVYYTKKAFTGNELPAHIKRDGKLQKLFLNFVCEPILKSDGRIQIFILGTDITEQVESKRKIEENEQRLNFALEASAMGAWELNIKTNRMFRTLRHDNIFGYSSLLPDWSYETFLYHVHPEDREYAKNSFEQAFDTKMLNIQVRIINPDKLVKWIEVQGQLLFDNNGEPERLLGVVADITKRKNLEKQKDEILAFSKRCNTELEQINHAKDKIISVISHDLRNPVSSIISSSGIILENIEQLDKTEFKRFVEIINNSSNKVVDQLNELVEWARAKETLIIFNPVVLNLQETVDISVNILEITARQKEIQIKNKVPHEYFVSADLLLLRSILQNLITNSIKYTPRGGEVIVDATEDTQKIKVIVQDTGVGMSEEVKDKIFMTGSVSTAGTRKEKGSGLGLMLVKDFVERHGGKILVESSPGTGTKIVFTLAKA